MVQHFRLEEGAVVLRFFDLGPFLVTPGGDLLLVVLGGVFSRLLDRPAHGFEQATDVVTMVGDAEGLGNLVLLSALVVEFPGAEATTFAPIVLTSSRWHAQYATMVAAIALDLYAVVSNRPRQGVHGTPFPASEVCCQRSLPFAFCP